MPRLHRGHTGVARLALGCDVPVIPVGIVGTREIQPPGSRFMRPFRPVTVRFGSPLQFSRERHGSAPEIPNGPSATEAADDPTLLRELTDGLMLEIARLSGQEYVDDYASRTRRKQGGGARPAPARRGATAEHDGDEHDGEMS